ncbi:MAG: DUF1819 family protein [Methanobacteriaceae archaeon]|nr:DUF1819 family protein [Methanobacteriaceae archaeon]
MKYSAGMAAKSFWYLESKKTAQYMLDDKTKKQILELAIKDNIYQVETENRAKNMANAIYSRLSNLPKQLLSAIVSSDITTSKVLVLISIMKSDRLFFEFMYEIFRNNVILGDFTLKDRDINVFFDEKKSQSEIVDKWTDGTVKKLKSRYLTILNFAGLIRTDSDKREIIVPYIDFRVKKHLLDNDMAPYMYTITGEK